ncbi:hypothetical protein A0H81_02743 [Grifola frondosa]|uniref:Uncharacterized protein n=1 Tax=Grifola frondosa TaxID=5627 RepID=A0A1C7MKH0_GRIFR|nr:hypothetical protein A0H81_02743 [Grifola frondosa]
MDSGASWSGLSFQGTFGMRLSMLRRPFFEGEAGDWVKGKESQMVGGKQTYSGAAENRGEDVRLVLAVVETGVAGRLRALLIFDHIDGKVKNDVEVNEGVVCDSRRNKLEGVNAPQQMHVVRKINQSWR